MPTKEELIQNIRSDSRKTSYNQGEVIHMVHSVSSETRAVTELKVGDIVSGQHIKKKRPFVIVAIKGDYCLAIALTSSEHVFTLSDYSHNNRFIGPGYFTYTITTLSTEECKENVIGVFEDPELITQVTTTILRRLAEDLKDVVDLG